MNYRYLVIVLALGLCACANEVKKPLIGERIPIILETQSLQADISLQNVPVNISAAKNIDAWSQKGASATHNSGNIAYSLDFSPFWQANIGKGGIVSGSILAAGDFVFSMDADYRLSALDSSTGKLQWQTDLANDKNETFGGGIALYKGVIFASDGYGRVTAVDASDGSVIWVKSLLTPIRSSPVVESDIIIVTSIDNRTTALKTSDGSVLWRHQGFQQNIGFAGIGSPAIIGAFAVVPYSSGEVYAFRVTDGTVLWQTNLSATSRSSSLSELGAITADPVIDTGSGHIYAISNSGLLSSLDIRSGAVTWELRLSGGQTPTISGDYLFIVSNSSQLLAIRKADGAIHWQRQLPHWQDPDKRKKLLNWKGPLMLQDNLFLINRQGGAILVDTQTGETSMEVDLSGSISRSPIVADEVLYILYDNAYLAAYR